MRRMNGSEWLLVNNRMLFPINGAAIFKKEIDLGKNNFFLLNKVHEWPLR